MLYNTGTQDKSVINLFLLNKIVLWTNQNIFKKAIRNQTKNKTNRTQTDSKNKISWRHKNLKKNINHLPYNTFTPWLKSLKADMNSDIPLETKAIFSNKPCLKEGIILEYVIVDFISMGLLALRGARTENYKMKNSESYRVVDVV